MDWHLLRMFMESDIYFKVYWYSFGPLWLGFNQKLGFLDHSFCFSLWKSPRLLWEATEVYMYQGIRIDVCDYSYNSYLTESLIDIWKWRCWHLSGYVMDWHLLRIVIESDIYFRVYRYSSYKLGVLDDCFCFSLGKSPRFFWEATEVFMCIGIRTDVCDYLYKAILMGGLTDIFERIQVCTKELE